MAPGWGDDSATGQPAFTLPAAGNAADIFAPQRGTIIINNRR